MATTLLGFSLPTLPNPSTTQLPRLPGTLNYGSIIISLFGTTLDTLAQYAAQKIIPKKKTQQQLDDDRRNDNKHVVKMSDVSDEIDRTLNSTLMTGLYVRTIAGLIKNSTARNWTDMTAGQQAISDAEWEPIREDLKTAIRKRVLGQDKPRAYGHIEILGSRHLTKPRI